MVDWLVTACGGAMVAAVLVDIFHTLASPGRQGRLSRLVHTTIWRLSRRSAWSGPLAMLAVIGVWGVAAVVGWALVYWPHMPDGFTFPAGSSAASDPAFLDALYVSMVTISTLGFGDVFPDTGWLRVANPLEAIFGFALLTIAVSWVLQVYPALSRRRALALRLTILERAGTRETLSELDPTAASALLHGLAADIVGARVDLGDYAETYYFREKNRDSALPATLGIAQELATTATQSPWADVQFAGRVLELSIADLLAVVEARFLRGSDRHASTMTAYLSDHRHHES